MSQICDNNYVRVILRGELDSTLTPLIGKMTYEIFGTGRN